MGGFFHLRPPTIFFKYRALVTFVPSWGTNVMQKIGKPLRAASEISKDGWTNGRTTDKGNY